MKVPFLDLHKQNSELKPQFLSIIEEVIDSGQFIQGKFCEEFEAQFLELQGIKYGVGCSNGTSAITCALKCLDVKAGDEVITVGNTFIADAEAIEEVGAKIVLVDCCPTTYNMDISDLKRKITSKTKVIIPVHLYGNPCDMDEIMKIAKEKNIKVIEDCAQSHLAEYKGQKVGNFGDFATFSFYPGKNLGAFGDAGFIASNDQSLITKAKMYINHGRMDKYEHKFLGTNFRMDGIQGAILSVKAKYLKKWTEVRRNIAKKYDQVFEAKGFKVIKTYPNSTCSYHLYIIEVSNRAETIKFLSDAGIHTGIHYPIPLNLQPALKSIGISTKLPNAESIANRIISLPICTEMNNEQINYVISNFLAIAKN